MKMKLQALVFAGLLGISGYVMADDEARLQHEEARLNEQTEGPTEARVDSLAKQYNVESAQVETIRSKTGWGGATIQLAMAENLMKTNPEKYPTMTDALNQVTTMRADGKGYGVIAQELGFKLGPVVRSTRHSRIEMRRADHQRPPRPEKPAKAEKPPKPEKPPKY